MSLANDLLTQADALLAIDARRPRQVNLRRAISSAYYALFHRLIEEAVSSALGKDRTADARRLRHLMARWYSHSRMKETSRWFRRVGKIPDEIEALLGYSKATPRGIVPIELERVATTFANLQEARHRADYDTSATFSRRDARGLLGLAHAAFGDWDAIAGTGAARLFLLLLLIGKEPVQTR